MFINNIERLQPYEFPYEAYFINTVKNRVWELPNFSLILKQ